MTGALLSLGTSYHVYQNISNSSGLTCFSASLSF